MKFFVDVLRYSPEGGAKCGDPLSLFVLTPIFLRDILSDPRGFVEWLFGPGGEFYPHEWEIEAEDAEEAERIARTRIQKENERYSVFVGPHCKDCKERQRRHEKSVPKNHDWVYLQRIRSAGGFPRPKYVIRQYRGPWPRSYDRD